MHDLGFWDIYWPILSALISMAVVFESFHFGISYWMSKRQLKKYLELQEKVKSGEIKMPPELMGQMVPGMMGSSPFDIYPTASGTNDDFKGSGQYL